MISMRFALFENYITGGIIVDLGYLNSDISNSVKMFLMRPVCSQRCADLEDTSVKVAIVFPLV